MVMEIAGKNSTESADFSGPLPRLWLVFFSDAHEGSWWRAFLRRGFGHVSAAAWYADAQRWVWFNPTWRGLVIEAAEAEAFGPRFEQLVSSASAILRVRSRYERTGLPAAFWCVGAVKALLGISSRALSPYGLYRHLLARGAEIVEAPARRHDGVAVFPQDSAGGSGHQAAA